MSVQKRSRGRPVAIGEVPMDSNALLASGLMQALRENGCATVITEQKK